MSGWRSYLDQRARQAGGDPAGSRLAVNLDIDNTAIATVYDFPAAVPTVLSFARYAHRRGFAVLFNTARAEGSVPAQKATEQLRAAGYPVDGICFRRDSEDTAAGKQRCRHHFGDEGYDLVADVGNNDTDFVGGGAGREFRLPNYGGRLS